MSKRAQASYRKHRTEQVQRFERADLRLAQIPRTPFEPRGAAKTLLAYKGREVVIAGPAGTGKTRACLEKVHQRLEEFPGARVLLVRKTRDSLSETALVTYEDDVLGPGHYLLEGPQRLNRSVYKYRNGSVLVLGGLDKASRLMSSQYDMIFVPEVTEIKETDWEALATRLRHGRMDYHQILGDCNPAGPRHWILRRALAGLKFLKSIHQDNPILWNGKRWTPRGRDYVKNVLGRLTGALRERLLEGRWAQTEGAIYPNFDITLNVTPDADYNPNGGDVIWGCDDGYAKGHERVVLMGQKTAAGGVNIFWEYARCFQPYDATIKECLGAGYPKPKLAACGVDSPHLRGELSRAGVRNAPGNDSKRWNVENGVRKVRQLICDGQGVRLLHIHPRCKRTIEGLQSYRADDAGRPVKEGDNEVDAARYMARYV